MRLNLGAGRSPMDGYLNVDIAKGPGIDLVIDLDHLLVPGSWETLPWAENTVSEIRCEHTLEHLSRPLALFQELWRVAEPGCTATFVTPYGSSDDADEDPTHVRRMFLNSYIYFSQGAYWRADYGYRGDWDTESITLSIQPEMWTDDMEKLMFRVRHHRNVVEEMTVVLRAIKPLRSPAREFLPKPEVLAHPVGMGPE